MWALAPDATNGAVAVAIVVIVVSSLLARQRRMAAVWSWPLLVLGALVVAMWGLGTPDSWAWTPSRGCNRTASGTS